MLVMRYFQYGNLPIVSMEGMFKFMLSRETNKLNNPGRIKASSTTEAVFMPSVLEKTSIMNPKVKAQSIKLLREASESNFRMK
jgi:hypothetical protein